MTLKPAVPMMHENTTMPSGSILAWKAARKRLSCCASEEPGWQRIAWMSAVEPATCAP